jgi:hypothetical protein
MRYQNAVAVLPALVSLVAMPAVVRAQAVTIPTERIGEYFYASATIKGQPVRLIIDSGAGAHVLLPAAAQRLGVIDANAPATRAVGTGGSVEVQRVTTGEITLGGAKLREGLGIAVPLPAVLEADGLLGHDLFQQFVVTMDYPNNRVTLTPPKEFKPTPDMVEIPLRIERRMPQIEVTVDGVTAWVDVDTGSTGSLDLYTPFVEKNNLRTKYPKRIESPTGRGVGGLSYGEITRAAEVKIGPYTLKGPLLVMSKQKTGVDASGAVGGRIGVMLLSRFAVTFDHSRNRLYLKKGPNLEEPFAFGRSGLAVDKEDYYFTVIRVIPGSPGAEAGVRVGDQVIAVEGKAVNKLRAIEMRDYLRAAPGTKRRLTLRDKDNQQTREVTITLRDIL